MAPKRRPKKRIVIHSSNGHLGSAPTKEASFRKGVERNPDFYISDSGSADMGPRSLGMDVGHSPEHWQKHDLKLMLLASRRQKVPMIIGSARDNGTNKGVDLYVSLIKEIAKEEELAPFKLTYIYSDLPQTLLYEKLEGKAPIRGLGGQKKLTREDVAKTDHAVAVMGIDPIINALEKGADVVITGRSSDTAIFAAAGIWAGLPEAQSYFAGKALECASFCAEPYGAKDTVLGTVTEDSVVLEAMAGFQKCTPESVAGHLMYERETPHEEYTPRGMLSTKDCAYRQISPKATRVTGMKFIPSKKATVKIEGSGKVGERAVAIVGVRDPMSIEKINEVIEYGKKAVEKEYGGKGNPWYKLYYHVYGKDGVMGELEPVEEIKSHELCVVIEAIAPDEQFAKNVALMGAKMLFYAQAVPGFKGTAGAASILFTEVLKGSPAYQWTINHVMEVEDPIELFHSATIDVKSREET